MFRSLGLAALVGLVSCSPVASKPSAASCGEDANGQGDCGYDLVVTDVHWTPVRPVPGDSVVFSATILNQGLAPTPSGLLHEVHFFLDGSATAATWSAAFTGPLAAGASADLTATGGQGGLHSWVVPAGRVAHDVLARVRIAGESDETNNDRTATIPAPLVDPGPEPEPLACRPVLSAPVAGASLYTPFPNLTWDLGDCVASAVSWYEVRIARDVGFAELVEDDHSFIRRHVDADGLEPGPHYWKVRAVGADGSRSAWSDSRAFTIAAPARVFPVPAAATTREAIQAVLDQAMAASNTTSLTRVVFPASGTYSLDCPATDVDQCFDLRGAKNITVEGSGASFLVRTPAAGLFAVMNSLNLTLRNFSVDYDPLPYFEGEVVEVNRSNGYIVVEQIADPYMRSPLAPHMTAATQTWSILLEPTAPGQRSLHCGGVYSEPSSITAVADGPLGERRFKVAHGGIAADAVARSAAKKGDIFHKQARINGRSIFSAGHADNLSLDAITVYASPSGFMNAPVSRGIVVVNSQSRVKPGRYASTDADTLHAENVTLGPWVENNSFWGGMDDYVNLRPNAYSVTACNRTPGAWSVTVAGGTTSLVGDRVFVYDMVDGSTAVVQAVGSQAATGGILLKLDGDPGTGTKLYASREAAPGSVFRYNSFLGGLRYGLLLRTVETVVEGNVFDRNKGSAIALENHPWRSDEGLASQEHFIVKNQVHWNADPDGSILAAVYKCDTTASASCSRTIASGPRLLEGIRLVGNDLQSWQRRAIRFENGSRGEIRCNTIGSSGAPALPASDVQDPNAAIYLGHSTDMVIDHNRIDDPRPGFVPVYERENAGTVHTDNGPTADPGRCLLPAVSRQPVRGATTEPVWP